MSPTTTDTVTTVAPATAPEVPSPMKEVSLDRDDSACSSQSSGAPSSGAGTARLGSPESRSAGTALRPPPINTTAASEKDLARVGGGPGNMPSGISVQELKQMTALRMAHEQGHVRVVSPFHASAYGEMGAISPKRYQNVKPTYNVVLSKLLHRVVPSPTLSIVVAPSTRIIIVVVICCRSCLMSEHECKHINFEASCPCPGSWSVFGCFVCLHLFTR